jgi:hypothetical protein
MEANRICRWLGALGKDWVFIFFSSHHLGNGKAASSVAFIESYGWSHLFGIYN